MKKGVLWIFSNPNPNGTFKNNTLGSLKYVDDIKEDG